MPHPTMIRGGCQRGRCANHDQCAASTSSVEAAIATWEQEQLECFHFSAVDLPPVLEVLHYCTDYDHAKIQRGVAGCEQFPVCLFFLPL